ncbi:hypothetical protein [Actinokineospora diospyrosa]|uniref:Uncharacterized protein n=1 Tax=Actinokineospora diospyrosa TaxID=103728 RepID=A0ABT1I7G1_9PSEU|nr:hypothetical protein [Actinokineospora diospyrosa]MCP2268336.1 hypothetical protein [Actinokineospora diospyrosa]
MIEPTELEARVVKPHRVTAASLALIDGGAAVRAWDGLKGITAPAEFRLVTRGRHHRGPRLDPGPRGPVRAG